MERELFDALAYCLLPTTRGDLVVMADAGRTHVLPVSGSPFRVTDVSRQDGERPWVISGRRLYMLSGDSGRALAFDLPWEPWGAAADLDAIVGAAMCVGNEDASTWVINTRERAEVHRLVNGQLTMLGSFPGALHTAAHTEAGFVAAGSSPNLADEITGEPLLVDLHSGARFETQRLNEAVRQWCATSGRLALPTGYWTGRLYCDAFLGMDTRAGRGIRLVGGLAEAALPQDLSAGLSTKSIVPGVMDYTGMAHFSLAEGELNLLHVDWEHRFVDTVQAGTRVRLYMAKRTAALRPALRDLCVCDDLFDGVDTSTPLLFEGISPDENFNKFSVAYRSGRGYLAVANLHWGFTAGKFAPRDLILTSEDGVHWRCAGSAE